MCAYLLGIISPSWTPSDVAKVGEGLEMSGTEQLQASHQVGGHVGVVYTTTVSTARCAHRVDGMDGTVLGDAMDGQEPLLLVGWTYFARLIPFRSSINKFSGTWRRFLGPCVSHFSRSCF